MRKKKLYNSKWSNSSLKKSGCIPALITLTSWNFMEPLSKKMTSIWSWSTWMEVLSLIVSTKSPFYLLKLQLSILKISLRPFAICTISQSHIEILSRRILWFHLKELLSCVILDGLQLFRLPERHIVGPSTMLLLRF